jgi:hypothetical protein
MHEIGHALDIPRSDLLPPAGLSLKEMPNPGSLVNPVQAQSSAIIISTRGRPAIVGALVAQLAEQSKPPDHVFVVGTKADDVAGLKEERDRVTVRIGRTGLTLQRNDGLALAGSRFSYIVFFLTMTSSHPASGSNGCPTYSGRGPMLPE